jgi:hypothetical protein
MVGRQAALVLGITAVLWLPVQAAQADTPAPNGGDAVQPVSPTPTQPPPPAPRQIPAPPLASADPPAQPAATGQWVYTDQYGWVWMPYGDRYVHVVPGDDPPDMYLYDPPYGWCWVSAPWIWGCGPLPFFGGLGWGRFGWWGNGYGHWGGFAARYRNDGRAGWGGRSGGFGGRSGGFGGRSGGFGDRSGGFGGRTGGSGDRTGGFSGRTGGWRGGGGGGTHIGGHAR